LKPIDGRSVGLLRHKHEDMGVFVFVVSEKHLDDGVGALFLD
jgi:hypothetical protein